MIDSSGSRCFFKPAILSTHTHISDFPLRKASKRLLSFRRCVWILSMTALPLAVPMGAIAAAAIPQWDTNVPGPERYRILKKVTPSDKATDSDRGGAIGSCPPQVTTQDIAGDVVTFSPALIGSAFEDTDADQSYICQIRSNDRHGALASWAALLWLATNGPGSDSHQDDKAPNEEAHLKNDGIPDSDPSVMILTPAVGNGRCLTGINIKQPNTLSLAGAEAIAPHLLKKIAPEEYQFAYGLLDFKYCFWPIRPRAPCDRPIHYAGYICRTFGCRCTQFFQNDCTHVHPSMLAGDAIS